MSMAHDTEIEFKFNYTAIGKDSFDVGFTCVNTIEL